MSIRVLTFPFADDAEGVTPLYSFSLFLPTILKELGYSSVRAQLLSVPPYAIACVFTVLVGFLADRTRQRGVFNIGFSLISIAGFGMVLGGNTASVRYAGTYLAAIGIYPCVANTISWISNNVEGVYKRGVSIGLMIGGGNLNGVVSSNIYRGKDAPRYRPGHIVVLVYLTLCMFGGSVLQRVLLQRENAKRRAGKRDGWIEGRSEKEIEMLGDRRYVSVMKKWLPLRMLVNLKANLVLFAQAGFHLHIVEDAYGVDERDVI